MTDESEYLPGAEFIGMHPGLQIDQYFISVALFRMPDGGFRYIAEAADTARDEYEELRCFADRDFESEHDAAIAGSMHIWRTIRSHQGLPDDSHIIQMEPE